MNLVLRADLVKIYMVLHGYLVPEHPKYNLMVPDSSARRHMFQLLVPAYHSEISRFLGASSVSQWNGPLSELTSLGVFSDWDVFKLHADQVLVCSRSVQAI